MKADRTMNRSARLTVVILLAGLVQVALPGATAAQNDPWQFISETDPLTDKSSGVAVSLHGNGGNISFVCVKGQPISLFLAAVSTVEFDTNPAGQIKVAWRIDSGVVRNELWKADTVDRDGGAVTFGQNAYKFALAVARAQERIVFRDANGTVVFDAKGSTKAIKRMLEFCGLEQ